MGTPQRSSPGLPVSEIPISTGLMERLYKLDYIKSNSARSKLLLMPLGLNKDQVVEYAKRHCREKFCTFIWVEPAITTVEES